MKKFFLNTRDWAKGKNPVLRLLLLLFFVYIGIRHLINPEYKSLFGYLNLGIHELGHIVFMPFGRLIEMAGGSLLQCMVPLISIFIFLKQEDYFAISVSLGWEATNLFEVSTYIGDAQAMELPLVTPFGGEAIHDWAFILGELHLLHADHSIAVLVRVIGLIFWIAGLVYGGWIIYMMFSHHSHPRPISKTKSGAWCVPGKKESSAE